MYGICLPGAAGSVALDITLLYPAQLQITSTPSCRLTSHPSVPWQQEALPSNYATREIGSNTNASPLRQLCSLFG